MAAKTPSSIKSIGDPLKLSLKQLSRLLRSKGDLFIVCIIEKIQQTSHL